MTRPIKFRAWNKEENRMMEVSHLFFDALRCASASVEPHRSKVVSIHESPIMQFTGLHDKNGKEIWEGDIVRYFDIDYNTHAKTEVVSEIIWDKTDAMFCTKSQQMMDCCNGFEVLGNIYENPELLK